MDMNFVILTGRIGKDAEMRYTPGGKAVATFSLAVSDGTKDKPHTTWWRVSVWDKTAENLAKYLLKGGRVGVRGRVTSDDNGNPRTWQDGEGKTRASYELSAADVYLLGDRQQTEEVPF